MPTCVSVEGGGSSCVRRKLFRCDYTQAGATYSVEKKNVEGEEMGVVDSLAFSKTVRVTPQGHVSFDTEYDCAL